MNNHMLFLFSVHVLEVLEVQTRWTTYQVNWTRSACCFYWCSRRTDS